ALSRAAGHWQQDLGAGSPRREYALGQSGAQKEMPIKEGPMTTSIRTVFLACLLLGLSAPFAAAQDHEGCTDHPLFNRMPNYDIYRCATVDFDAVDFAKPGLKQWDKPE